MSLVKCLENLRKLNEKETMKKQKYFKIKPDIKDKEEKISMVGRTYLRNKQQHDYRVNLRKKNTNKKIRKVISNEEFNEELEKITEEEKRKEEEKEKEKKKKEDKKEE